MAEMNKSGTTIQSLQVGMNIVDIIAKQGRPLRFSDIQELTQVTKSNLYKYLNTFTQLGILYREKESGTYTLGSKLIQYGMAAIDQENVLDRIAPYLQEINQKCSSTVLYCVWTHNGPMVVRMFNASQGLNIGAQIGTLLPILSASGKLFYTFMDDHTIREWKEKELKSISDEKIKQLEEDRKTILEKEISFAREPLVQFVNSVAFPVFNFKKNLLGTVTVVGFSQMIPQNEEESLSRYLLEVSREISASFGYQAN